MNKRAPFSSGYPLAGNDARHPEPENRRSRAADGPPSRNVVVDSATERLRNTNYKRIAALSLHYLLRRLGYLEFTDVYSIDLVEVPAERNLPDYSIIPATESDIDYICRSLVRDQPPFVIRKLWSDGHQCFVARHAGQVVAYNWVAFTAAQEEEYTVELRPEHALCLNAYTAPRHRGRGLHDCLLRAILRFAAQHGKTKAYTCVSLFNMRSWKSHIRMGWKREFTVCYFRPNSLIGGPPWLITACGYPVAFDWQKHSWLRS